MKHTLCPLNQVRLSPVVTGHTRSSVSLSLFFSAGYQSVFGRLFAADFPRKAILFLIIDKIESRVKPSPWELVLIKEIRNLTIFQKDYR